MKLYRAKITMSGGYISTLQSDTVFGGLCWAYKAHKGETAFHELLDLCRRGTPPFVVSDIFPGDYLPKPFLPLAFFSKSFTESIENKETLLVRAKRAKQLQVGVWLTVEEFNAVIMGKPIVYQVKQNPIIKRLTVHNTVNRNSGTTLETGGLYDLPETFCACSYQSLYLKIMTGWEEDVWACLELLGQFGVGKRRSIGKGSFSVVDVELFDKLLVPEKANSFISLSHFIPGKDDPVEGYYKVVVKYGRVDREYAHRPNPFKYPLMLFLPGSVFYTESIPRNFYGRAVENIVPGLPEVIQGCFSLAIPARLERMVE